jgi:hypothetical protein
MDTPWLIISNPFSYRDQALLSYPSLLTFFVSCNTLVAFGKIQVPKIHIANYKQLNSKDTFQSTKFI